MQATEECVRLLMTPSDDNKYLVMGLKKMLITKQEVLQMASAQCVHGLLAFCGQVNTIEQIVESGLVGTYQLYKRPWQYGSVTPSS